jgi:hypothetical protein
MTTLKIWDGTAWQTTSGQGANGQGVPAGGAAGAPLVKNSAGDYDTKWGTQPGQELAYAEVMTNVNVTATAYATADVLITAPAVTFDGGPVVIEYFAPAATTAPAGQIGVALWDGSTDIGIVAQRQASGTGAQRTEVFVRRRLSPSAGAHTFSVRAVVAGGTAVVGGGVGGASALTPAFIRITRV